jgi:hypothetical protein
MNDHYAHPALKPLEQPLSVLLSFSEVEQEPTHLKGTANKHCRTTRAWYPLQNW